MTEPEDGSIVAWFDVNGDIYAVLQRADGASLGGPENWYAPVAADQEPMVWLEALDEYRGFRGPVLLESAGRVS